VPRPEPCQSAASGDPRFRSILLICAANTARSIIAEHLLLRELKVRRLDGHIVVRSAGIAAYARDGALVSLDTRMTLREDGIHLDDDLTSTDLKRHPELLEEADLVIAMTARQAEELRARFPVAGLRPVYTIRTFVGEEGDIEDPFEQGDTVFSACREEIKRLIPRVVGRLLGEY
jgi:protein-tyrosine-phosphatase